MTYYAYSVTTGLTTQETLHIVCIINATTQFSLLSDVIDPNLFEGSYQTRMSVSLCA
jgi:hypothetical protein